MLKIDRTSKSFSTVASPSLASASITERYDLQEFISNSPDIFFRELGLEVFLIGSEIEPSVTVQDRIDLLALDKEGCCVVVELKRGNHKMQMLQAISYAGMIGQWSPNDFLQILSPDRQEQLTDFLEVDSDEINRSQRIILVAEEFDYALLAGAEWLTENYGVDILCCRIALAKDDDTAAEFLVCSNIYPAPELAKEAVSRGRQRTTRTGSKWTDWDSALAGIENPIVAEYYREQLATNRESYLLRRTLHFRLNGKRRWDVLARQSLAYVWQKGRFKNDVDFWKRGLTDPSSVEPVKRGECVRFFLRSKEDFDFFHNAVTDALAATEWSALASDGDEVFDELPGDGT